MTDRTHTVVMNHSNATSLRDPKRLAVYAVIAAIMIIAPHIMPNSYWLRIYTMTGLWVMLALGLNVVAGFAGLLDLAYVAFFGMGGYTFALLSSSHMNIHLPFILVLPLAAFFTMVIGIALGIDQHSIKG